jgi:hypothetical protein
MVKNFNGDLEHSIGNGEVDSSILSGSTILQNSPTALAPFFRERSRVSAVCGGTVEMAN